MSGSQPNVPVWEEGGWDPLPRLEGAVEADVCVVGLGGSGLSAVLQLLEAGRSVVGVDAGQVAGAAAGRNGGLLLAGLAAFHHDAIQELGRERATRMYRLTEEAREHELGSATGGVRRVGSLRIAASDDELEDCAAQLAAMREDDLAVEAYSGPEGQGLHFPGDAVVNPLARCRDMARRALREGARLFEGTRVEAIEPGRVTTEAGVVECGAVIVAVDGRLSELLPELAEEVRTARLQMLATAPTDELAVPKPVYRRYGFEYYQRTPAGRIALGGFRDQAGEGEWTRESAPAPEVQERLESFLRGGLGVQAPITHRWAASVGFRAGVLPLARLVRERVWAIGGYNGTGNLVGAVLGRAAAEVAMGRASETWELFGGSD